MSAKDPKHPKGPRISSPHLRGEPGCGYRCRLKTPGGKWVQGPTRLTEQGALAAAAQKLAELDAAAAGLPAVEAAPSQDQHPGSHTRLAAPKVVAGTGMRIQGVYFESARQR